MPRQRKDRVDENQRAIVAALREIPGVTVEVGKDDILVGCMDKNFIPCTRWYEIKNPDTIGKDGNVRPSAIKKSQKILKRKWTGHFKIVTSLDEILIDMGLKDP
jgi:hypothetical protein